VSPEIAFWNDVFEDVRREGSLYDANTHWLVPYVPMMRGQNVTRVLEIGCGSGSDTKVLVNEGFDVTATDFSTSALQLVREQLPDVPLLLHDVRDPFSFRDGSFDMVLASLSLHYFDDLTTRRIAREMKRLLRPRGLLLYRLNSTSDPTYGDGQWDLLEKDFFLQNGIRRRYFSLDSCRSTFQGWEEIVLEEKTVDCYGKPKSLCEGLLRHVDN
jgi:SAM-dependent methyltransferase